MGAASIEKAVGSNPNPSTAAAAGEAKLVKPSEFCQENAAWYADQLADFALRMSVVCDDKGNRTTLPKSTVLVRFANGKGLTGEQIDQLIATLRGGEEAGKLRSAQLTTIKASNDLGKATGNNNIHGLALLCAEATPKHLSSTPTESRLNISATLNSQLSSGKYNGGPTAGYTFGPADPFATSDNALKALADNAASLSLYSKNTLRSSLDTIAPKKIDSSPQNTLPPPEKREVAKQQQSTVGEKLEQAALTVGEIVLRIVTAPLALAGCNTTTDPQITGGRGDASANEVGGKPGSIDSGAGGAGDDGGSTGGIDGGTTPGDTNTLGGNDGGSDTTVIGRAHV